jgi:site-specific DNA-methyltransferase (adenine-specific)
MISDIRPNNIYQEDCLAFMDKLKRHDISVDVIVTSPPYNINKAYSSYRDNKKREEYIFWLRCVAMKSLSILKQTGSFFINIGEIPSDPLLPIEIAKQFLDCGFKLQNVIHWIKSISLEKEDIGKANLLDYNTSIGHFKPILSQRFLSAFHEYIFHFTKTGDIKLDKLAIGVVYQDKTNIGRWKSARQDKRDRGNVWFIPYSTVQEARPHPATFPEKLPLLCIKLHGIKRNMLVYDPFMGIGSTALACINLNVNYIGTEIDGEYLKLTVENIDERTSSLKRSKHT